MRFGLILLVVGAPAMALATPRSAADCASIENPFSYNECLASFGPKVGEQRYTAEPPQAVAQGQTQILRARTYRAAAQPRATGPLSARRSSDGRFVAEFQVGGRGPQGAIPWRRRRHY